MFTHARRGPVRVLWTRGCMRPVPPDRARDEDLHVFLKVSKRSRKSIRWYIDRLLGPA